MKLISTLIAIAFASTLSFGAVAAQHMGAAPAADAPAAQHMGAAPAADAPAAQHMGAAPVKAKKEKKAKTEKAMEGDAATK